MTDLLLRRATEPRAGAEGRDDYDVMGDVASGHAFVIGRIFRASMAPAATPWMWTLGYERRQRPGADARGCDAGACKSVGKLSMTREQPASVTIRQIEFELEKAEHGMGLPYDAERVGQLRSMLREARKKKLSAGLKARRKQR